MTRPKTRQMFACLLVSLSISGFQLVFSQRAQTPPERTCTAPEYRQFDFWVGNWRVEGADGELLGTNHVDLMLKDCVLQENWEGSGGTSKGTSFNIYNRQTKKWHQTWVSDGGDLLQLEGNLKDGKMVLEGETISRKGEPVLNRIIWTPMSKDHVRQQWEISQDGGANWKTIFDGHYKKTT